MTTIIAEKASKASNLGGYQSRMQIISSTAAVCPCAMLIMPSQSPVLPLQIRFETKQQ
jgi:hypothetical protein